MFKKIVAGLVFLTASGSAITCPPRQYADGDEVEVIAKMKKEGETGVKSRSGYNGSALWQCFYPNEPLPKGGIPQPGSAPESRIQTRAESSRPLGSAGMSNIRAAREAQQAEAWKRVGDILGGNGKQLPPAKDPTTKPE